MPHPRPDLTLTVDVVLLAIHYGELCVLTIRRDKPPYQGTRTLPGGFLRPGETSLEAARRVLQDKAGVSGAYLEQLYTFDGLDRDPRGHYLSVTYLALTHLDEVNLTATDLDARFVPTPTPLGFDHNHIVNYSVQRLRNKLRYTTAIASLLPGEFTLSDLQSYYQLILGEDIDKRNFRKRWLAMNLLADTHHTRTGLASRPAKLYRFQHTNTTDLPRWL